MEGAAMSGDTSGPSATRIACRRIGSGDIVVRGLVKWRDTPPAHSRDGVVNAGRPSRGMLASAEISLIPLPRRIVRSSVRPRCPTGF